MRTITEHAATGKCGGFSQRQLHEEGRHKKRLTQCTFLRSVLGAVNIKVRSWPLLPFGQDRALLGRLHAAALPELKRRLSLRRAAGRALSSGASPTSRRMVVATLHRGRSGNGRWGGGGLKWPRPARPSP